MSFTGTAVVKEVTDGLVRVTGVSLSTGADGTIALFEKTGGAPDVRLPESFKARAYSSPEPPSDVTLQDCVQVMVVTTGMNTPIPVNVVKTGTTPKDFLITLSAVGASENITGDLEIYIRYH